MVARRVVKQRSVASQESDGADRPKKRFIKFCVAEGCFFDLKIAKIDRRSGVQTCRR
ncbi:hypothetical protein QT971_18190 [Microcoleus sp. herbarium19]|uniref:hypothetical protein n=1 Tax=unclassified Microcoleus TaxID=2642155 RepID=UPI002FCE8446